MSLDTLFMRPDGTLPFSDPPFFFSEEEGTWNCATCGEIKPRWLQRQSRWLRQSCPCEKAARLKKEEDEREQARIRSFIASTYCWLGEHWSDAELATKTFENFDQRRQSTGFDAAEMFAGVLEGTLVLHSVDYGTGKTHLLAAVCNRLREQRKYSRFTTAPNLFRAIQERIQHDEDYHRLIQVASEAPFLVIDDIDKTKYSEFREEIYFAIVDKRVKRGLPSAISTNRLDDLPKIVGGAVASRLKIGQIDVEMNGEDYRKLL